MRIGDLQFYQIAVLLISLVMIYFGLEKYFQRQATQTFFKLLVRIVVWGGMSLVALFPPPSLRQQLLHFLPPAFQLSITRLSILSLGIQCLNSGQLHFGGIGIVYLILPTT